MSKPLTVSNLRLLPDGRSCMQHKYIPYQGHPGKALLKPTAWRPMLSCTMEASHANTSPTSLSGLYGASVSQTRESLSYQRLDMDLSLSDSSGREVHLSVDLEQLAYRRTYNRHSLVAASQRGPADHARGYTGEQLMAQYRYEHESVAVDYTGLSIQIEGDTELLADYFGTEETAQRIFDHVTGLIGGAGLDEAAYSSALDQVTRGVAEGFAEAEAILGELPEVSRQTQDLLDLMLGRFRETGEAVSAADLIHLLDDDQDEQQGTLA